MRSPPGQTRPHRAELNDLLIQAMSDASRGSDLARLFIFGISSLPPHHLEAQGSLRRDARGIPVSDDACREYWSDIVSERQMNRSSSAPVPTPRAFTWNGVIRSSPRWENRKGFSRLVCGVPGHGGPFLFVSSEGDTMLHCLQNAISWISGTGKRTAIRFRHPARRFYPDSRLLCARSAKSRCFTTRFWACSTRTRT